jgi:GAF domain-containing protein
MLTDPLFASAREASVKSGIRAAFSVPVIDAQGKVLGSLACHYRKPFSPTAYEIERNHLFATLIAFALVRDWDHTQKTQTAESYLTTI